MNYAIKRICCASTSVRPKSRGIKRCVSQLLSKRYGVSTKPTVYADSHCVPSDEMYRFASSYSNIPSKYCHSSLSDILGRLPYTKIYDLSCEKSAREKQCHSYNIILIESTGERCFASTSRTTQIWSLFSSTAITFLPHHSVEHSV